MRILVVGAYGFIGSHVARSLAAAGHNVVGVGRNAALGRRLVPSIEWVAADLRWMLSPADWQPHVANADVVVNASGLLQGTGGEVETVQLSAIVTLLSAAEEAGVKQLIQISAAGASANAPTDFMRTKFMADEQVCAGAIPSLVLRPGLVIGRNSYGGTELLRMVAAAPVGFQLPFAAPIQCVALTDITETIQRAIDRGLSSDAPIDLAEEVSHTLDEIIAAHRTWLGLGSPKPRLQIPKGAVQFGTMIADLLGRVGWRSPLRTNAIRSLEAGVIGDSAQAAELLGRPALSLKETLSAMPAGKQDRLAARMALAMPLVLASLFALWFGSAILTFADPVRATAPLLANGLSEGWARSIALGGAAADIVLAVGLAARRTVRPALLGMLCVTILYLAGSVLLAPQLWIDPLAPLLKAIPAALLALVAYWLAEER
jgi:uncharacterized protein YbjT (DUF2867 family)